MEWFKKSLLPPIARDVVMVGATIEERAMLDLGYGNKRRTRKKIQTLQKT
jgi:hypothetical protein